MRENITINGHTGDLFTVREFRQCVKAGAFIDYDGCGDAVKDGKIITPRDETGWPKEVKPSKLDELPEGTTHVLWYNR